MYEEITLKPVMAKLCIVNQCNKWKFEADRFKKQDSEASEISFQLSACRSLKAK